MPPTHRRAASSASLDLPAGDAVERDARRDRARARRRARTAIARAAAFGAVLRGGLSVGKIALAATRRGRRGTTAGRARKALRDVASYAAFLATFAGTYVSADEGLRRRYGGEESKAWRCALAGACAGPSLMLAGSGATHYGLAGYIWVRSIVLLTRVAQKSEDETMKRLTAATRMEHGDCALMVGSAAVILSCFILRPETVEPAYKHFLDVHGGKTREEYAALRTLCEAGGDSELRALCARLAISNTWSAGKTAREMANKTAVGAIGAGTGAIDRAELYRMIFFRGASNAEHFLSHVVKSFAATLSVYAPVYLVPAALIHREKLLSREKGPDLLSRIAVGSARSALFLSSYVGAAWSGVDLANRAFGGSCDGRSLTLGVSMAGLATFIEKKSRRMELAMYCTSRAIETAALMAVYRGFVPNWIQRRRADVFLFSVASATIMHCYNTERDVFRSKYLSVLDFIFGSTGHDSQSISHAASYEILFEGNFGESKRKPAAALPPGGEREMQPIRTYVTEEQFHAASAAMKDTLSDASVSDILKLYGLYKQATVGDACNHPRPSVMDQRGRAKYSSWSQFEGMSAQQAMTGYCMLVDDLTTAGKFKTAPVSPASSTNAD